MENNGLGKLDFDQFAGNFSVFNFWKDRLIPAFLSFDVEPDGFQLSRTHPPKWPGYSAMFEIAEKLRSGLFQHSGVAPQFGWYFRTDPQIAAVYDTATSALVEFPERVTALKAKGDYLGVHVHPIRWCEIERAWVHDVEDTDWTVHCTEFALDAFARWQGSPALRFRAGAGFLSNKMIQVLDERGVKVELSLEPIKGWWLYSSKVQTAIDSSPIVGRYTDCDTAPRIAYRPAYEDFRVMDKMNCRSLIMIPNTTTCIQRETSFWRRAARPLKQARSNDATMLYPSIEWPSPRYFWDLVACQLRSMPKPYLSLGVRTDAPGSPVITRVRQILDALPRHPLAERLRFADPIEDAPGLI